MMLYIPASHCMILLSIMHAILELSKINIISPIIPKKCTYYSQYGMAHYSHVSLKVGIKGIVQIHNNNIAMVIKGIKFNDNIVL